MPAQRCRERGYREVTVQPQKDCQRCSCAKCLRRGLASGRTHARVVLAARTEAEFGQAGPAALVHCRPKPELAWQKPFRLLPLGSHRLAALLLGCWAPGLNAGHGVPGARRAACASAPRFAPPGRRPGGLAFWGAAGRASAAHGPAAPRATPRTEAATRALTPARACRHRMPRKPTNSSRTCAP